MRFRDAFKFVDEMDVAGGTVNVVQNVLKRAEASEGRLCVPWHVYLCTFLFFCGTRSLPAVVPRVCLEFARR